MTVMRALVLLAAVTPSPLLAQQAEPCGPYVLSSTPETELTPAAFGASSIDDLCIARDPNVAGGFFGFVVLPGAGAQAFRWTPGSAPVPTTQPGVPSASAVRGISIGPDPDPGGRLTVVSTRPAFFPGFYTTYFSKVTPDTSAAFSDEAPVSGASASTQAPDLGRLAGQEVLVSVSGQFVRIADTDTDPTSTNYGTRVNERTELLGYAFVNNGAAIHGNGGEITSILIGQDGESFLSTTPTLWLRDVVEGSTMPIVGATSRTVTTSTSIGLAFDWVAQLDPATYLVQYANGTLVRLQVASTSSTAAPRGQTSTFDVRMPSERQSDMELCFAAMTLAGTGAAAPVGAPMLGNFCLSQTALVTQGMLAANTGFASFSLTVPNDPFWVGVVLSIQGFGFEVGSANGYFGNVAAVEIVN